MTIRSVLSKTKPAGDLRLHLSYNPFTAHGQQIIYVTNQKLYLHHYFFYFSPDTGAVVPLMPAFITRFMIITIMIHLQTKNKKILFDHPTAASTVNGVKIEMDFVHAKDN